MRNLQNEYPGGNTNTQAAIQTARTQLFVSGSDRSDAQNILIVITDGVPTIRPENTIPEADTTKRNNIDIFAVGITRFIDEDTLKQNVILSTRKEIETTSPPQTLTSWTIF